MSWWQFFDGGEDCGSFLGSSAFASSSPSSSRVETGSGRRLMLYLASSLWGYCRFCGKVKTMGGRGLTREVVFNSRLPVDSGLGCSSGELAVTDVEWSHPLCGCYDGVVFGRWFLGGRGAWGYSRMRLLAEVGASCSLFSCLLVTVVLGPQKLIGVNGRTFGSGPSVWAELAIGGVSRSVYFWDGGLEPLRFSALESVGWQGSWVLVQLAGS
ncbi:tryptophan synthase alpha chain [Striga asiatica]|uniref:Tryptophan synthase alpha chain n=1 Tax=Striga asiatica TaxID=4170 RepID=A0A5A7P4Z7_STRAF|nr:tryptophan synthase alpha chain [Striga asiatica]